MHALTFNDINKNYYVKLYIILSSLRNGNIEIFYFIAHF